MRLERRPAFTPDEAERLAFRHYGLKASASPLPSERDQNFKLETEDGAYVLKLFHPDESPEVLSAQRQVLERLAALPRKVFPRLSPTKVGETFAVTEGQDGMQHQIWLVPFIKGEPVAGVAEPSGALLSDIGRTLAEMDRALSSFHHPALERSFQWAPQSAPGVIRGKLEHIRTPERRKLLEAFLKTFEADIGPLLPDLRQSVIHNDVNDHNLLVEGDRVSALLDFGDMLKSYTLCDTAHACAYLMLGKRNPLEIALGVLRGYQRTYPLTETELYAFYDFIRLRLALSVAISAHQQRIEPDNLYLSVSERPAWRLLEQLEGLEAEDIRQTFASLNDKEVAS